jgi:hypothetical protein
MFFRSVVCTLFLFVTVFGTPHPHHKEGHSDTDDSVVNLNEYRLDVATNKYQRIGSTSSCKPNMRFFAVPNNTKDGLCDCDKHDCSRALIYSPKTQQCHWAYSQGPCQKGEWFTFDKNLSPVCEKHTCTESPATGTIFYNFKNPADGKCYEAGTKGYCKEGEILMMAPYEPIPECRSTNICYALSLPEEQECIPGNRRTFDGFC